METYLYKLKFLTPIHLSSDPLSLGKAEVILHSDTLFSAIANSFAMLFSVDDEFFSSPPFTISSAFPYYKETLFLPKPIVKFNIPPSQFEEFRKKIKKAKFISVDIFNKFVNGAEINLSEENFSETDFISEEPIKEKIYSYSERPRALVPRAGGDTAIFYSNAIKFGNHAGLYFFASFQDNDAKKQFDSALYLLGDNGIGGERSAGYGLFKFESQKSGKIGVENGEYFMALSLYCPTEEEIKSGVLKNARYAILTRQNWIFSGSARPMRSKSIGMFTEGSVFLNTTNATGKMTDITPEIAENRLKHRIIRYGKVFKIPLPKKAVDFGGKNE